MKASYENPIYTVMITTTDTIYDITPALTSIDFSEQEKQISVCANISFMDTKVNGKKLSSIFSVRDSVTVYADVGTGKSEVFRGYVWDMTPKESLTESEMTLKCYDMLIYWQESDDSDFFVAGHYTYEILYKVAKKWGFNIGYEYETRRHEQLVMRGKIADFITEDVLATVQKSCGNPYVIQSKRGSIKVKFVGANETVYKISKANNAIELRKYISLNGVITRVVILGTASDDEKTPIEATIEMNTDKYGTLQSIISRSEDTTLEEARNEALRLIYQKKDPQWEYDISATDIPWIRKGDKVELDISTLKGFYLVKSINRDISNKGKTMSLTVVEYKGRAYG